jgi:tetratricopeptide (TPR) repeat protein
MHSKTFAILVSIATLAATPPSWQADRDRALTLHAAGNYREAERLFRAALASLKQNSPDDPNIPEILNNLGADCHLLGKYAEAEQFYRNALAVWKSRTDISAETIARTLGNLATTYRARGLSGEAETAYKEALQAIEGDSRYIAQYAFTLSNLADLERMRDKPADSLPLAQRAVKLLEGEGGAAAPRLAFALQSLAATERALGHVEEAGRLYRKALTLVIAQNGDDHPVTAAVKTNLAEIALKLEAYADAETLSREAMATWQRTLGPSHARVGVAAVNLAQSLRFQQRYTEAAPLYERALELLDGGDRARCLADYADMNYQQGKPVAAVDLYRKALDAAGRTLGADHPQTALIMTRLAEVRRNQGLYAESVKLYRLALPKLEGDDLRQARRQYDETLKEASRTMLLR